jgi:hypothetical protein
MIRMTMLKAESAATRCRCCSSATPDLGARRQAQDAATHFVGVRCFREQRQVAAVFPGGTGLLAEVLVFAPEVIGDARIGGRELCGDDEGVTRGGVVALQRSVLA